MIPVDQTKFGERAGNCFAACIASILGLSLSRLPNFCAWPESEWWERTNAWLAEHHGVRALMVVADSFGAKGLGELSDVYHIKSGDGPRGLKHSVVGLGEEVVHDPHPSRSGLVKIETLEFLIPCDLGIWVRTAP